jgi:signal transduction histidine kinase
MGTEMLLQTADPEDPRYSLLMTMKKAAERMARQVKQMSRIARYQTTTYVGQQKMIDLEAVSA